MHRLPLLFLSLLACASLPARTPSPESITSDYAIGADVSFLQDAENHGLVFKEDGKPEPGLQIFRDHGYNWIRLRVFEHPTKLPNSLPYTISLAKKAQRLGFKLLLDFHYSDTWADPKNQTPPEAWANRTPREMETLIHNYSRDTIKAFKDAGVLPDMVQPGNEITYGILWPSGHLPEHWDQFEAYLKAAIKGIEAGGGNGPRILIQTEAPCDWPKTKEFFDHLFAKGIRVDVIGQSYYPWWHGSLLDLKRTLTRIAGTYNRDVMVVETAYCWKPTEYTVAPGPFPETPEGQRAFLEAVNQIVLSVPDDRGVGVFWWEPAVAPSPIRARGMFDDGGNALPVISAFDSWTRGRVPREHATGPSEPATAAQPRTGP